MAPVATGIIAGGAVAGPVGSFLGAVSGLLGQSGMPSQKDLNKIKKSYNFTRHRVNKPLGDRLNKVKESYNQVAPDLQKLLNEKEEKSVFYCFLNSIFLILTLDWVVPTKQCGSIISIS